MKYPTGKSRRGWRLFPFGSIGLLIIGMSMLTACETVIDIDPPDYDSELNVISKFSPDSVWAARVTKTLPINSFRDRSDAFMTDAKVIVYEGDVLIDRLLHDGSDEGWYVSSKRLRPQPNTRYRMVVEAQGFRSVSAVSLAPSPPVVSNLEVVRPEPDDDSRQVDYLVRFSLENRAGLNYYDFSVFLGFDSGGLPGAPRYYLSHLWMYHDSRQWYCDHTHLLNPLGVVINPGVFCSSGILSDRFSDGQTMKFEVYTRLQDDFSDRRADGIILIVNARSPEYIEYQSSIEEQDDEEGFGEPVNLYTNVEGGHGIFAGYSTTYHILDIPARD